jgi:hypothetical protein
MSASGPLQTAVFARLNAVAGLAGKVFDEVPQGQAYPFVVIGEDTINEMATDDSTGVNALVQIHTWSTHAGFKEVNALQALINAALDRQSLTVTGWHFLSCDFVQHIKMRDPDGKTRHGVSEYRVLLDTL